MRNARLDEFAARTEPSQLHSTDLRRVAHHACAKTSRVLVLDLEHCIHHANRRAAVLPQDHDRASMQSIHTQVGGANAQNE